MNTQNYIYERNRLVNVYQKARLAYLQSTLCNAPNQHDLSQVSAKAECDVIEFVLMNGP